LWSDHSEEIHMRKSRRKSKPDFCWIIFVMPEHVSIGGNGIRFVIYRMRCIGGISILFVTYGLNLNLDCNIFCQRYYIYSIYILLQFSNGQETGINEPASSLLRAKDED
jgi:hypothetical protein